MCNTKNLHTSLRNVQRIACPDQRLIRATAFPMASSWRMKGSEMRPVGLCGTSQVTTPPGCTMPAVKKSKAHDGRACGDV